MAHYLIFIPHQRGADPQHLADVGLETLLRPDDDAPQFMDLENSGPGKLPGQIATWRDPARPDSSAQFGYLPDRQTWYPAKPDPVRKLPAERYWYGIETARPPRPVDLERNLLHEGFATELADGLQWLLPNCLSLPHRFDLDEQGHPCRRVKASYESVMQRALWAYNALEAQLREEAEIPWAAGFEYCAEMLSLNYRVDASIAAWLGLFDDNNFPRVMAQTVDKPALSAVLKEVKKKKTQEQSRPISAP